MALGKGGKVICGGVFFFFESFSLAPRVDSPFPSWGPLRDLFPLSLFIILSFPGFENRSFFSE